MYEVSTAYKNYINNNLERDYKVKLTVGTDEIDSNDIFSYSIETNQPSDKFTIGNAISKMLKIEIKNQENPFYTNQLYLQIGMLVNGAYEYVPIGYFNVDKSEKKDHRTTITAYDNMYKLEGLYVCKLGNTKTIKEILTDIASKTGIKMAADNYKNYTIADDIVGYSYREVIAMMAGLNGGNAYIDRTGKIKFVYLSDSSTKWSINDFSLFDGNSFKEQSYTIDKVTCYKDKDTSWSNGNLGTTPMTIEYENQFMTEAIANDIYNKLANIEYQAFNMETMSYLALDVGDWISYTSQSNTVYSLCIQHYKFSGGIKQTLEAKTDGNKNNFNTSGSLTQKVNRTITDLLAAKKAIIGKANIDDLVAGKITVETLNGGSATLQEIMTSFISGSAGQFLHLTGQNVVIDEAVIKDLIAAKISVGDLLAGNIDSERFNIVSKNGNLIIKDNTIQIKDSNRVRIQIGKDASGDYTLNAWDKNGKLLFNSNGITANAIKSKIIRDDMVADNANIDGSKVNIESLIECVNNNNTKTLNSSKIVMDGTTQTMDVSFKQLTSTVESLDVQTKNLYRCTGNFDSDFWTCTHDLEPYENNNLYKQATLIVGDNIPYPFNTLTAKQGFNFSDTSKTWTISAYFKASADNMKIGITVSSNRVDWDKKDLIKDTWVRLKWTFKGDGFALSMFRFSGLEGSTGDSVKIALIKVAETDKLDDWCPHQDDNVKETNVLQTEFNVQQGQINQLIKDTTITIDGTEKKLKDAYNETKSTVDGTVQTVAKVETQVNSLNLTNLLRAGGGDYLNVDSSIWSKAGFNSNDTFSLDGSQNNKWYRLFNSNSSGSIYVTNINPIKSPSDKKISLSFKYYCNDSNGKIDGIKNIRVYILQEHSNSNSFYDSYKMIELDKTTAAKLFKGTFTLNSLCTRYMIRFDLINNVLETGVTTAFRFKDIMVVNGTIPSTEWSPSFEDLQVDINSIEQRVSSCEVKTTDEAFTVQVQKNQNRQFNIRYIRDYANGSTSYAQASHWVEIQAISNIGTNLALNKTVTCNKTISGQSVIVDGQYNASEKFCSVASGIVIPYVQIDLGQVYSNIDEIKIWHYYADGRKYHNTKTEVSADGTNWVTLFDSEVSGTYVETVYGHSIKVNGTSFNSSQVTINELGLHVKNGSIDIQNNAGDTVFSSDSNGNLSLVGNITTKNNTTQKKCISLEGENINFYDWSNSTTRTTPVGTLYSSRMDYNANVPGIVLAHNKNAYMSFAYYNENDKTYHSYMTFDNDFITGKQYSAIKFNKTAVIGDGLFFGDKWAWMDGYSSNIWVNISTKNETDWSGKFGICKQDGTGVFIVKPYSADRDAVWTNRNTYINGDFCVSGNKNCVQHTDNYGDIKMYATEDFGSYFTWRPEGNFECNKKDSDNNYYTIIKIPEVVREVVNTNIDYIVQIMKLSFGDYKIKTFPGYFKVVSDKQLEFRIDYLKGYRKGFEDENYYNQLSKPVQLSNHSHNRIVKK